MWEDIRDNLKELHEIGAKGERFFTAGEVETLLADAEALLAVVRALEETNILIANTSAVAGLRAAHLALPAYLRE